MEAEQRRAQIIQAAAKTFARLGYQKANIYEICQEASIARGTLYQYFKNKNHLFREMLREYMTKITEYMAPVTFPEEIMQSAVNGNLVAGFLRGRFKGIYQVVAQEKDIFTVFFREALARHTEVEDIVNEWNHRFLDLMIEEIKMGMKLGIFQMRDPEILANFLLGGLFKLSHEYIIEWRQAPDLDRLAEEASSIATTILIGNETGKTISVQHTEIKGDIVANRE